MSSPFDEFDFSIDIVPGEVVIVLPQPQPLALDQLWSSLWTWVVVHREALILSGVLLVALTAQGINMFQFPYYENDEGTYLSQAWSIIHQGQLAPYTYWYDHAPFGWMQIALWYELTGGTSSFGYALFSGRILMLLLQAGSTTLVYLIGRRVTKNTALAVLAALLFALSPYGLYFHRRILLDNFATIWLLVAIALLIVPQRVKLQYIWLSGLAFALSVLSKESTAFVLPVLAYLAAQQAGAFQRMFAWMGWLAIALATISLYPLMAILKGEVFPTGTFLGGNSRHVSLLGTLSYQASRGKDGGVFDMHSSFWHEVSLWVGGGSASGDPLLVIGGTACALISVALLPKYRVVGCMGLATLSMWVFLARGGETIEFYFIPLLPLLALNIAMVLGVIADWFGKLSWHVALRRGLAVLGSGLALSGLIWGSVTIAPHRGYDLTKIKLLWQSPQAAAQLQALDWADHNIPAGSRIVMDDYMYTDLQDMHKQYVLYWYWKVDLDPAIQETALHGDWNNVDYIITSPQLLLNTYDEPLPLVKRIFEHSHSLIVFNADQWDIDIRIVEHRKPPQSGAATTTPARNPAIVQPGLPYQRRRKLTY